MMRPSAVAFMVPVARPFPRAAFEGPASKPARSEHMQLLQTLTAWVVARANMKDERGATMVEYGLLVALIAMVVAVGAELLGAGIDTLFDEVTAEL
jgi:pilus assembly protein Flp/PilA